MEMAGLLDILGIGQLRLKNRIVLPAMATEMANDRGEVTESHIRHYKERAASLGLIIVEHCFISTSGRRSFKQLGIDRDELIPGFNRLVNAVHDYQTCIAVQINHAGRATTSKICGDQPIAPSPIPILDKLETPREIVKSDMDEISEDFVKAACRAVKSGFDAVEIHGAHGYLLNQFTSPLSNKRSDVFGGSFENRIRFPLEVIKNVKESIGEETILIYRIGADDMHPLGFNIEEAKKFAKLLVNTGVQILDVSGGLCGARPLKHQGFFIDLASKIKSAVNVPVIGVGGIIDPLFADNVILNGKADLVAVGRALLKDPHWARKSVETLNKS